MKTEEIIILVFVSCLFISVPLIIWMLHAEEKRAKEEEARKWREKKLNKQ